MPKFARIVGGYAIDVYDAADTATLQKRMGVTGFVVVPADTKNNAAATLNPDGSVASIVNYSPPGPGPAEERAALALKLAKITAAVQAAALEEWARVSGGPEVQDMIAEKEQVAADLAALDG